MPNFSTFEDLVMGIEDHTTENLQKALETDRKEFLDTRYYCNENHSEVIKRHRSRRGSSDFGFPELPNLGRVLSHASMTGCDNDTLPVPSLNKFMSNGPVEEEYFDAYKSTQSGTIEAEMPPLMPLLGFTTLLSELCTVYLQMVNIILTDVIQNSCEQLTVYTYLVAASINSSGGSSWMLRRV